MPVRKSSAGKPDSGSCAPAFAPRASLKRAYGPRMNGRTARCRYVYVAQPGSPIAAASIAWTESVIAGPSGSVRAA